MFGCRSVFPFFLMAGPGALLFALLCTSAKADYRFCNHTSYVLNSAVAYSEKENWQSRGWFRLDPGSCRTVLPGQLTTSTYYVFAHSIPVHHGETRRFGGTEPFCTVPDDFIIKQRLPCVPREFDTDYFREVKVSSREEWTTVFSESREYNETQARLAGIQRLLIDNGYKIGKVDGYPGRKTTRAIMAFQRAVNVRPSGKVTKELFDMLVTTAEKKQRKTGLSFCNRTNYLVWAAFGYATKTGTERSSGWVRIKPGQCKKVIKDALNQRYYYTYAEAIDAEGQIAVRGGKELIWGGAHAFCTKPIRFGIERRPDCSETGFDTKGFRQIDTGEKIVWQQTLE